MKDVKVYNNEAFSDLPGKGNPAGVIFEVDELTYDEMQSVTAIEGDYS